MWNRTYQRTGKETQTSRIISVRFFRTTEFSTYALCAHQVERKKCFLAQFRYNEATLRAEITYVNYVCSMFVIICALLSTEIR